MDDLISRQAAIEALEREKTYSATYKDGYAQTDYFKQYNMGLIDGIKALYKLPSADAVEVVRCKDCKHQEKYFYADGRMKSGGRFIYGCNLAEGYSHICLDDDFCSRGERKDGNGNG